jgi:monoterpene epsilon-lactone hydrolase
MTIEAIQTIINRLESLFAGWGPDVTIERMRRDLEELYVSFGGGREASIAPVQIGAIGGEWVTAPEAASDRVVLYLHGGGFAVGSSRGYRHLAIDISAASGASVLVLDFRLVPETVFPGQLEDAVAAYRWLMARGISPGHIAIAGDSAGGGLTVALLVALRDDGVPLPSCAALLSPWVDLECTGASYVSKANVDPVATKAMATQMGIAYAGTAENLRNPLASPVLASLKGLPPLKIQAGEREIFLDDARTIARHGRDAGVSVEFDEWPGMIHQWHVYANELAEAREAIAQVGAFISGRMSST